MAIHPGDRGPVVRKWREVMNVHFKGLYTRLRGPLPTDTDLYGPRAIAWQQEYQIRTRQAPSGIVSDADLAALKIVSAPPARSRPWIFTVAGHMGGWDNGPAFWSMFPLHQQGRAVVQGIGYDTQRIPFNNKHGFERLDEAVTRFKPPNTDYVFAAHSQGAIIACDYIEQRILQRPDDPHLKGFKGGVMFGNPRRPMGVVAPWIGDPPPATHSGIAPDCLSGKLPGVEEASRRNDLYADKKPGPSAEYKVAIYRLIAKGELLGGDDSLTEQLGELAMNFGPEVWAAFQAIIGAAGFGINMDPHNIFDLTPPREHVARILGI